MWAASILGEPVISTERPAKRRVAILISGRGTNMTALIAAAQAPDYPAEIALVLSNRPDAQGIATARAAGLATAIVDHTPFGKDRAAFERALQGELETRRIDIVCLAGFMRLFTADFVSRWQGRMLNVHPALLPAFKGLDIPARALAAGVKIHGASVHFVTPEMDSGPIIAQGAVAVREDDTADTLAARVLALEHAIYPLALSLVAQGRVRIEDGRCRIDGAGADGASLVAPLVAT
jgi:phosphoribosylglycinamide formyltransferase-1